MPTGYLFKKNLQDFAKQFPSCNGFIVLHARLKSIISLLTEGDQEIKPTYSELAINLVEALLDETGCEGILIPSFTYSFTRSGVYDQRVTKSETGRLGEEIRFKKPLYRTLDPVFSVIDYQSSLPARFMNKIQIDAFGIESLWHYLYNHQSYILNINMPFTLATQWHYAEYVAKVPYRYNKNFQGTVVDYAGNKKEINYQYLVRNLDIDTNWRYEKINHFLAKSCDSYLTKSRFGIQSVFMNSQEVCDCLIRKLANDPIFMIS
jgi:aminoglycoside N3'-acetyltransferase